MPRHVYRLDLDPDEALLVRVLVGLANAMAAGDALVVDTCLDRVGHVVRHVGGGPALVPFTGRLYALTDAVKLNWKDDTPAPEGGTVP
jgi:hypothetical protein